MLRAGVKMADRKDRMDIPVAVTHQNNGTLVVRGRQHLIGFDPTTKEIKWSLYFAAPGVSNFEMIAMTALTAMNTVMYQAGYASGKMSMNSATKGIEQSWGGMDKLVSRRYQATQSTEEHAYILTNVEEEAKKGVGLMSINLNSGETDNQILLKEKDPEYLVDDVEGRLYHFPNKNGVKAYSLK